MISFFPFEMITDVEHGESNINVLVRILLHLELSGMFIFLHLKLCMYLSNKFCNDHSLFFMYCPLFHLYCFLDLCLLLLAQAFVLFSYKLHYLRTIYRLKFSKQMEFQREEKTVQYTKTREEKALNFAMIMILINKKTRKEIKLSELK